MGKVILWKLYKKFKFDHPNKWYMHNPEFVLESETHKILKDFEIQTDHLISARWPDLVIVNKKKENLPNWGLCLSGWPLVKLKESKRRYEYQNLYRELEKSIEHEVYGDIIFTTPPLGQDMTQGQFLSEVWQVLIQSFSSPRLVASPRLKNLVCPTIYP